jgi:hypothetical protein
MWHAWGRGDVFKGFWLESPKRRWEDNIKLHLRETGIDGAKWIHLVQDRVQWPAFVNTIMNLQVP